MENEKIVSRVLEGSSQGLKRLEKIEKKRPVFEDLLKVTKEKGIDILLVTDMVKGAFQEQYQTALLATGDADYVPAVELVQTLKKEVINLHFMPEALQNYETFAIRTN